nr:reverse transcriptase domain-containing protein [Tanacetum cinerariifolium]
MTSTLKYRDVANDAIKLMLFSYSLEGAARIWYEKEPPNLILTWDDLVNKFVNQFFPPSKTTHLKNEIYQFTQRFEETFGEEWERFKEINRACPHHGFSELTQIDTFYNGLNEQDQDSLNATAGGNLLIKTTREALKIIENKTKGEMKAVTTRSGLAYEGPSIPTNSFPEKSLHTNKDKLIELAKVPLNENCLAILLKKLLEKLGDPEKFLIPCDFLGMDVCHALADLGASINLMPLSIWKKISLPELTPTRMTIELADRTITHFEADPRVPLILGRSFLSTDRALIDVYGEEITLRVNNKSVTFNLNQTMRYSSTYDDNSVNRIDAIDIACKEFVQDVLDFKYNSNSGNPTLVPNPSLSKETKSEYCKGPITKSSSLTLTPFGEKKLLNDDPSQLPPMDLKQAEETKAKSSVEEPPELELKELPSHLEYAFLEETDKLPVIIARNLKVDEKEALLKVLKSRKRPLLGKSPTSREAPFVFSKDCIDAFETLKKKLTEASILVFPDWNLPFELMCDASDFTIGAVLGQRNMKPFQPIRYASKTMTEAQIHYTLTEKEMLTVVYAFEKFQPYLVLSKSIVYMDHSALKYLLKNLTADHLSRLENPHKDVFENKDINENFPLETLGSISRESTLWFADIANFHAGNFIKKWAIISDRGTHFCNDQFAKVMTKYEVTHRLATAYHPQTSGQVEVSNQSLKRILKRTVGENRASWSDKLDDALWEFRTAFMTPIGCTPYKLVYEKSCHLPIELEHKAYWALKHATFDLKTAGDHRKLQLNELNELHDQAYENSLIYKERTKKLHDSKIKNRNFNVGDQVLLFNSRLKIFSRKLKTRWSGPFTITQVFPYGTVELSQLDGPNFKVNGHRVKHYFRGDIPSKVVPDLHTIPMDK